MKVLNFSQKQKKKVLNFCHENFNTVKKKRKKNLWNLFASKLFYTREEKGNSFSKFLLGPNKIKSETFFLFGRKKIKSKK